MGDPIIWKPLLTNEDGFDIILPDYPEFDWEKEFGISPDSDIDTKVEAWFSHLAKGYTDIEHPFSTNSSLCSQIYDDTEHGMGRDFKIKSQRHLDLLGHDASDRVLQEEYGINLRGNCHGINYQRFLKGILRYRLENCKDKKNYCYAQEKGVGKRVFSYLNGIYECTVENQTIVKDKIGVISNFLDIINHQAELTQVNPLTGDAIPQAQFQIDYKVANPNLPYVNNLIYSCPVYKDSVTIQESPLTMEEFIHYTMLNEWNQYKSIKSWVGSVIGNLNSNLTYHSLKEQIEASGMSIPQFVTQDSTGGGRKELLLKYKEYIEGLSDKDKEILYEELKQKDESVETISERVIEEEILKVSPSKLIELVTDKQVRRSLDRIRPPTSLTGKAGTDWPKNSPKDTFYIKVTNEPLDSILQTTGRPWGRAHPAGSCTNYNGVFNWAAYIDALLGSGLALFYQSDITPNKKDLKDPLMFLERECTLMGRVMLRWGDKRQQKTKKRAGYGIGLETTIYPKDQDWADNAWLAMAYILRNVKDDEDRPLWYPASMTQKETSTIKSDNYTIRTPYYYYGYPDTLGKPYSGPIGVSRGSWREEGWSEEEVEFLKVNGYSPNWFNLGPKHGGATGRSIRLNYNIYKKGIKRSPEAMEVELAEEEFQEEDLTDYFANVTLGYQDLIGYMRQLRYEVNRGNYHYLPIVGENPTIWAESKNIRTMWGLIRDLPPHEQELKRETINNMLDSAPGRIDWIIEAGGDLRELLDNIEPTGSWASYEPASLLSMLYNHPSMDELMQNTLDGYNFQFVETPNIEKVVGSADEIIYLKLTYPDNLKSRRSPPLITYTNINKLEEMVGKLEDSCYEFSTHFTIGSSIAKPPPKYYSFPNISLNYDFWRINANNRCPTNHPANVYLYYLMASIYNIILNPNLTNANLISLLNGIQKVYSSPRLDGIIKPTLQQLYLQKILSVIEFRILTPLRASSDYGYKLDAYSDSRGIFGQRELYSKTTLELVPTIANNAGGTTNKPPPSLRGYIFSNQPESMRYQVEDSCTLSVLEKFESLKKELNFPSFCDASFYASIINRADSQHIYDWAVDRYITKVREFKKEEYITFMSYTLGLTSSSEDSPQILFSPLCIINDIKTSTGERKLNPYVTINSFNQFTSLMEGMMKLILDGAEPLNLLLETEDNLLSLDRNVGYIVNPGEGLGVDIITHRKVLPIIVGHKHRFLEFIFECNRNKEGLQFYPFTSIPELLFEDTQFEVFNSHLLEYCLGNYLKKARRQRVELVPPTPLDFTSFDEKKYEEQEAVIQKLKYYFLPCIIGSPDTQRGLIYNPALPTFMQYKILTTSEDITEQGELIKGIKPYGIKYRDIFRVWGIESDYMKYYHSNIIPAMAKNPSLDIQIIDYMRRESPVIIADLTKNSLLNPTLAMEYATDYPLNILLNNVLLTDTQRISIFEYFKNKLEIPIIGDVSPERFKQLVEKDIIHPNSKVRELSTRKGIKSVIRKLLKNPISYWRGGNSSHNLKYTENEELYGKNLNENQSDGIIDEPLLIEQPQVIIDINFRDGKYRNAPHTNNLIKEYYRQKFIEWFREDVEERGGMAPDENPQFHSGPQIDNYTIADILDIIGDKEGLGRDRILKTHINDLPIDITIRFIEKIEPVGNQYRVSGRRLKSGAGRISNKWKQNYRTVEDIYGYRKRGQWREKSFERLVGDGEVERKVKVLKWKNDYTFVIKDVANFIGQTVDENIPEWRMNEELDMTNGPSTYIKVCDKMMELLHEPQSILQFMTMMGYPLRKEQGGSTLARMRDLFVTPTFISRFITVINAGNEAWPQTSYPMTTILKHIDDRDYWRKLPPDFIFMNPNLFATILGMALRNLNLTNWTPPSDILRNYCFIEDNEEMESWWDTHFETSPQYESMEHTLRYQPEQLIGYGDEDAERQTNVMVGWILNYGDKFRSMHKKEMIEFCLLIIDDYIGDNHLAFKERCEVLLRSHPNELVEYRKDHLEDIPQDAEEGIHQMFTSPLQTLFNSNLSEAF